MRKYHNSNDNNKSNENKYFHMGKNIEDNKSCEKDDIFCQCKNHPRYRPCVCLAFPNAEICIKDFCKGQKNKNSYECNPKENCLANDYFMDKMDCGCKDNFDFFCECKLNPLSKECFCKKYPISYLCNTENCSSEKESIFCRCKTNEDFKNNDICQDYYCRLNPNNPQCFCLVYPEDNYCKCLNDPSICESNKNFLMIKFIYK